MSVEKLIKDALFKVGLGKPGPEVLSYKQPFSRKSPLTMELSEQDLNEAYMVAQYINSEGWKTRNRHVEVIREQLIEKIKKSTDSFDSMKMTAYLGIFLKGFDIGTSIDQSLVDRAAEHNKAKKEMESEGGFEDGY